MMRIAELWRYPVKSMAGESLQVADVRETGIVGDRVVRLFWGKSNDRNRDGYATMDFPNTF